MVRKGSPVRVRTRALYEGPAHPAFYVNRPEPPDGLAGQYRVSETGLNGSARVARWAIEGGRFTPLGLSTHRATMSGDQLELPFIAANEAQPAVDFLTIAEAARRERCCERTIRRAIESGVLRAGRVHSGRGSLDELAKVDRHRDSARERHLSKSPPRLLINGDASGVVRARHGCNGATSCTLVQVCQVAAGPRTAVAVGPSAVVAVARGTRSGPRTYSERGTRSGPRTYSESAAREDR